jgi:hypothetical protein
MSDLSMSFWSGVIAGAFIMTVLWLSILIPKINNQYSEIADLKARAITFGSAQYNPEDGKFEFIARKIK